VAFNIYGNGRRRSSVSMADIDAMSGLEFESFVGDLLKSLGYSGVEVTKSSGDQGVDVIASKDGTKYAIQCKNYSSPLNNKPIQEVTTGKAVYGCDVGVVLTNSTFNQHAVEAANATGTLLWDRQILQKMLSQSNFAKPISPVDAQTKQPPVVQINDQMEYHIQQAPCVETAPNSGKKRNVVLYVIGIVLLVFNGLGMFAGIVTLLQSGFDGGDVALFSFLLVFFLLGLFFVLKNKNREAAAKGSYRAFQPYSGKPISWIAVGLCLYFFFPVGFYLLYKKMSQYANATELLKNSKTLKNWATVFMCLGGFCIVMAISAKEAVLLIAIVPFIAMGILLLQCSKMLSKIYGELPSSQKVHISSSITPAQSQPQKTIDEDVFEDVVQDGGNFDEFRYHAGTIESTYIIVHCKGCNAPNRIIKGSVAECEYCGAPVGEQAVSEQTLDNEEAAISKAFAVMQRLLESMDEVSDDLSEGFDRLTHAMETFPNRSMPLDVELNRVSGCLNNFAGEAKRISAGIRAQVMIACDNLMAYDDESWEKVEVEVEKFTEIKNTLSETISSMRTFRHTIETLNVNAGFQTYKIKTAQIQLTKVIDQSLSVLQFSMADFTESIKTFRNAKFTSKTQRINAQKRKGGQYNGL
jgi:hypothetical protein